VPSRRLQQISSIALVVGLEHEQSIGSQYLPNAVEEGRRQHPELGLGRIIIGLRMINVDLVDRRVIAALEQPGDRIPCDEAGIRGAPFLRRLRRPLQQRDDPLDPQIIDIRVRGRGLDDELSVAAADVDDPAGAVAPGDGAYQVDGR
jgi:hypothetical protein